MAAKVPNQYKDALRSRRPPAVAESQVLQGALDAAARAMVAGAWQSSVATDFEHALVAHRNTLRTAADSVATEFDAQIGSEPDLVEPNSWEALFYKMQRMMY